MNTNGSTAQKRSFSDGFVRFFDRFTPNSMVFAYILTIIVAILALIFTDTPILFDRMGTDGAVANMSLVNSWVAGFWNLLTFGMQMALIMITGSIVATSPPVRRALIWIANKPKGAFQAYATVVIIGGLLNWFHWGVGMMVSIQLGRQVLAAMKDKGVKLNQASMVGAAYSVGISGNGISQAAPLLGATPGYLRTLVGEQLAPQIPEVTPMTESALHPLNLIQCAILFVVVFVVAWIVQPKSDDKIVELSDDLYNEIKAQNAITTEKFKASTPAEWIDNSPLLSWIIGAFGLFWIIRLLVMDGFVNISINNFNFLLLMLGVVLCGSPNQLIKGATSAVGSVWGVIMQFPFYAGIFGIIVNTGLSSVIVDFFMSFANQDNFPTVTYIYSSILNMAVPSGGSKFAIEAPYLLDICARLDIPIGKILNAYTFGDQTTNIIQPFWALPYLSLFKIDFKKILPYTFFACVAGYVINLIFFIFIW